MRLYLVVSCLCFMNGVLLTAGRTVDNITETLTVSNGGIWGQWGDIELCPDGSFVKGYSMRIEENQFFGDDTALNEVRLYCDDVDNTILTSAKGPWGGYTGVYFCETGDFVKKFNLRVEQPVSGDDTAANKIKFKCQNIGHTNTGYEIQAHTCPWTMWGSYGGYSDACDTGTAVCGIQTRRELVQNSGDDTSLNDVKLFCCPP